MRALLQKTRTSAYTPVRDAGGYVININVKDIETGWTGRSRPSLFFFKVNDGTEAIRVDGVTSVDLYPPGIFESHVSDDEAGRL